MADAERLEGTIRVRGNESYLETANGRLPIVEPEFKMRLAGSVPCLLGGEWLFNFPAVVLAELDRSQGRPHIRRVLTGAALFAEEDGGEIAF